MSLPEPLPAPLREALAEEVRRAFGLTFTPARYQNLELGLHLAAKAFPGEDLAALLGRLERQEPDAQHAVVTQLVVGETYFFRHAPHFALLRSILERWRDEGTARPRRLWSAGCSSGEEAYSMAIAALEILGPGAGAVVSVLGTDINPLAIARAEAAIYDEWSFREVPDAVRERWFVRAGGRLRVRDEARALVRFEPLNLLPRGAVPIAGAVGWPRDVDVIFCRNVVLYFDAEGVAETGEALALSLVPGGVLVLGPADPRVVCGELTPVERHDILYYERADGRPRAPARPPKAPPPPASSRRPVPPSRRARPVLAPAPLPLPAAPPPPAAMDAAPEAEMNEARRRADAGDVAGALEILDRVVDAYPLDAEARVLRAIVLQALSDHARAVVDAERAILLDRTSPMAHVLAAVSHRHLGQEDETERCLRNARRLLSSPGVRAGAAGGAALDETRAAAEQMARALGGAARRRAR